MFNVILCSVMILYAQPPTFTFTEDEVIELYNKITELEYAHTSDSLIVNNLEEEDIRYEFEKAYYSSNVWRGVCTQHCPLGHSLSDSG